MKALSINELASIEARAADLTDFIAAHQETIDALEDAEAATEAWRTWTAAGPRIRHLLELLREEIADAEMEREQLWADVPSEEDELRAMFPRSA